MPDQENQCGLDVAFSVICGKWKPLILFHLWHEPRRFGELAQLVAGASEKVLTQQLKELQLDGIVDRVNYRELPPRVVYSITEHGRSLALALKPLCDWGSANRQRITQTRCLNSAMAAGPIPNF